VTTKQRRSRNGEFLRRRSGVRLDAEQYDYQLDIRGITSRKLAEQAGVTAVLLSKARHGEPISEANFRKIVAAFRSVPILDGAGDLLAKPRNDSLRSGMAVRR
jgi:hypothetical protein